MTTKRQEFLADLALVFVGLIWGVTFLPMAKALATNGVFVILFYRFLIAFILMALISLKFIKKIDTKSVKYGAIVGVFLFAGFALQTFALKYTFSSTVAFITGLVVIFVPFLVFVFFRTRIKFYSYVGATLATIGLYILCDGELGFGLGELLSLLCAFAYAFEIMLAGYYVKKCEIFVMVATEFLVVCVLSLVCTLIFEGSAKPVIDREFVIAVGITATFATVFAFFVQNLAQRYTTPVKTVLILTLEPVGAGFIGYFLGGEILTSWQIFGAVIILVGILASELGSYLITKEKNEK
ncbi:DMT family transporter [Campylobacter mucosalis]|uniref:Putative membrane protein, putative permease (EamA domain), type 5 n=1 Tax=Campylobacter mucosalis CCUG 21559 TaxID=1032067 RepID=A0A6G5QIQ9_9BACT|nr:DMT family transporter [Campylobacter mucosalis]KEA45453.1 membrane protein [Campylobacter mucosalis]QCD45575.1 putative membrane protein, putative permease (EamA domain), type 5 [Campylobacter mucosalis CCUG 21559]QKF63765.1 EamA/RhaT family transporter, type 5 [Campylobacter mucosalis]